MKYFVIVFLMSILSISIRAETVVIVHPSNDSKINQKDIRRLFLGKKSQFPNGKPAVPVYLSSGSPERDVFEQKALRKTKAQLKAYWAQQVFTGIGEPPEEYKNSAEVLAFVASNPNAIGYIEASHVDASVKVIISYRR